MPILNLKYRNLYKAFPCIRLLLRIVLLYQYRLRSKVLDFLRYNLHILHDRVYVEGETTIDFGKNMVGHSSI